MTSTVSKSGGARASVPKQILNRLDKLDQRFDRLDAKVDAVHRDVLELRAELVSVIDPKYRPLLAVGSRTIACLAVCILAACGGEAEPVAPVQPPPAPPPEQPPVLPPPVSSITVRFVYASPSDRPFNAEYSAGIERALVSIREWYGEQLGGRTFTLQSSAPEWCQMAAPHESFITPPGYPYVWDAVETAVQDCVPLASGGDPHVWVVYADVMEPCADSYGLGRGGGGLAFMGAWDLEGLSDPEWDHCGGGVLGFGRWIGGLGHEIGHAFGLPHPPGCDAGLSTCDREALMAVGFAAWPDTYLRGDEKKILLEGPFMNTTSSSEGG